MDSPGQPNSSQHTNAHRSVSESSFTSHISAGSATPPMTPMCTDSGSGAELSTLGSPSAVGNAHSPPNMLRLNSQSSFRTVSPPTRHRGGSSLDQQHAFHAHHKHTASLSSIGIDPPSPSFSMSRIEPLIEPPSPSSARHEAYGESVTSKDSVIAGSTSPVHSELPYMRTSNSARTESSHTAPTKGTSSQTNSSSIRGSETQSVPELNLPMAAHAPVSTPRALSSANAQNTNACSSQEGSGEHTSTTALSITQQVSLSVELPQDTSEHCQLNAMDTTAAILEQFPESEDPMLISGDTDVLLPEAPNSDDEGGASSPSAPSNPTGDLPEPPNSPPSVCSDDTQRSSISVHSSASASATMSLSMSTPTRGNVGTSQKSKRGKLPQLNSSSSFRSVKRPRIAGRRSAAASAAALAAYGALTEQPQPRVAPSPSASVEEASSASSHSGETKVDESPASPVPSMDFFGLVLQYQQVLEEKGLMSMEDIRDADEEELVGSGLSRDHARHMQAYLHVLQEGDTFQDDRMSSTPKIGAKNRRLRFAWRRAASDNSNLAGSNSSRTRRAAMPLRFVRSKYSNSKRRLMSTRSDDSLSTSKPLEDESPIIDLLVVTQLLQYDGLLEEEGFASVGDLRGTSKQELKSIGVKGRHAGRLLKHVPLSETDLVQSKDGSTKLDKVKTVLKKGAVLAVGKLEGEDDGGGARDKEDGEGGAGGSDKPNSSHRSQNPSEETNRGDDSVSSVNLLKRGLVAAAKRGAVVAKDLMSGDDDSDEDDGSDSESSDDEEESENDGEKGDDDEEGDDDDESNDSFLTKALTSGAKMALKHFAGDDDDGSDEDSAPKAKHVQKSRKPQKKSKPKKKNSTQQKRKSRKTEDSDGDEDEESSAMMSLFKKGAQMGANFVSEKLNGGSNESGETGNDAPEDEGIGTKLMGFIGKGAEALSGHLNEEEGDEEEGEDEGSNKDDGDKDGGEGGENEDRSVGGALKGLLGKGAGILVDKFGGGDEGEEDDGDADNDGAEEEDEDNDGDENNSVGGALKGLLGKGADMLVDKLGGGDDDEEDDGEENDNGAKDNDGEDSDEDENGSVGGALKGLLGKGAGMLVDKLGGGDEDDGDNADEDDGEREKDDEEEDQSVGGKLKGFLGKGAEMLAEKLGEGEEEDDEEETISMSNVGKRSGSKVPSRRNNKPRRSEAGQDAADSEEEDEHSAVKKGLVSLLKAGAGAVAEHFGDDNDEKSEETHEEDGIDHDEEGDGPDDESEDDGGMSGKFSKLIAKGAEMVADKLADDKDEPEEDIDGDEECNGNSSANAHTRNSNDESKAEDEPENNAGESVSDAAETPQSKKRARMRNFIKRAKGVAVKNARSALPAIARVVTSTMQQQQQEQAEDDADEDESK